MKSFVKILAILIQIFFLTEYSSGYETPVIIKKIDLEKAGVVADFNMSITEEKVYNFCLYYMYDIEQEEKEIEELKKKFPNTFPFPKTNTYKTMTKIVGIYRYDKLRLYGSKIVLKLTLTPLFNLKEDYVYYTQDYYHYTNYYLDTPNMDLLYSSKRVMKSDKPFEYIMDLSEYGYSNLGRLGSYFGKDYKEYGAYAKIIVQVNLPKGDYRIELDNLEDVPEVKQIETTFSIHHKHPNW